MKKTIFLLFCFFSLSFHGIAQTTSNKFSVTQAQKIDSLFTITIDSVSIESPQNPKVLLCYTTIKNLSKETIEFSGIPINKECQEWRMWSLKIKKEDGTLCMWENNCNRYSEILGNFTIKKNKSHKQQIALVLDEMIVDSKDGVGKYTIQIEVSNVETKKVKKQTLRSNIVGFQIEAPIEDYYHK